jgi:hypothetical protein
MSRSITASIAVAGMVIAVMPAAAGRATTGARTEPGVPYLYGGVVAVRGDHHVLLANHPGHRRLHDLGGHIGGTPAVAYAAGHYLFVAATIAGKLEVRTEASGWAPLVKHGDSCTQPELSSDGSRLALVCLRRGALFAEVFTAPKHGLPRLSRLHKQGGHYRIGAGIAFKGHLAYEETVGKHYQDDLMDFDTYTRRYNTPRGQQIQDSQFNCMAPPTVTSAPKHGRVFSGCVAQQGDQRLLATAATSPNASCGGADASTPVAATRIGIAPAAPDLAVIVYRGARRRLFETTFSCNSTPPSPIVIARHIHGGPALAIPVAS